MILGVVVAAVSVLNIRQLAEFLGARGGTVEETVSYLRIIVLGAPFMMGQFVINNQLRYQGSAMYAMVGLLCGAILNIALDPLLIFGFGMGVTGAALATVSGQIISFFVLLAGSMHGVNIHLNIRNVRLNGHFIVQIINGGIPGAFKQGCRCLRPRSHCRNECHHQSDHVRIQRIDRLRSGISAGLLL